MLQIVQYELDDTNVLTTPAQEVVEINDKIRILAMEMMETMKANNGIGLAAPQVGIPLRVIVGEVPGQWKFALVNPVVKKRSRQMQRGKEGCLSFKGMEHVEVERPKQIKVEAATMTGQIETFKARGLLATVLLHEIDHLDGVTLADHGILELNNRVN